MNAEETEIIQAVRILHTRPASEKVQASFPTSTQSAPAARSVAVEVAKAREEAFAYGGIIAGLEAKLETLRQKSKTGDPRARGGADGVKKALDILRPLAEGKTTKTSAFAALRAARETARKDAMRGFSAAAGMGAFEQLDSIVGLLYPKEAGAEGVQASRSSALPPDKLSGLDRAIAAHQANKR